MDYKGLFLYLLYRYVISVILLTTLMSGSRFFKKHSHVSRRLTLKFHTDIGIGVGGQFFNRLNSDDHISIIKIQDYDFSGMLHSGKTDKPVACTLIVQDPSDVSLVNNFDCGTIFKPVISPIKHLTLVNYDSRVVITCIICL